MQFEIGSTATAYEPYHGTTIPDLLPEGTDLRSLPDGTKDQLNLSYLRPSTRAGWAWYSRELVQRVASATFDGTDMSLWSVVNGTYPFYVFNSGALSGATAQTWIGLSVRNSRCTSAPFATISATGDLIGYFNTNMSTRFRYQEMTGVVGSLTELAAYFAEHPTTFDIPMSEIVTIILDPIELPQLPAPSATVWCDGGSAAPTLVLEYVKDANATIAELSEAIADIVSG